jgi:hypothetical protein
VSNSLCGGASFGGSSSLSKMLDLASHRAFVTGEWYIPGHRLMGFRPEDVEFPSLLSGGEGLSKGEANVETTGMVLEEGEEFKSMEYWNLCMTILSSWKWAYKFKANRTKIVGELRKKERLHNFLEVGGQYKVNGQCSFSPLTKLNKVGQRLVLFN